MTTPFPANTLRSRRQLKDRLFRHVVRTAGLAVLFAVVLIFAYLLFNAVPLLFGSGRLSLAGIFSTTGAGDAVWQPAAAGGDISVFNPRPLIVGTLKASLYALLFGVPLAFMTAIHLSYYASAKTRRRLKPAIEILEALPTVVLGFLAAVWLAPWLMNHLLHALMIGVALALLPPLTASLNIGRGFPVGLMIIAIPVAAAAGFWAAEWLESLLFDRGVAYWLQTNRVVSYSMLNALVVGAVLGISAVPAMFSIAEEALSGVPRHLINGAMAVGANRWQTLSRVVLPVAASGLLAALLIGFGRVAGETMIVLMASGNTPLSDWGPFSGFRSLSATLALELPETSVNGFHFQLLFFLALLLFVTVFILNSVAELIRHRLRTRYRAW